MPTRLSKSSSPTWSWESWPRKKWTFYAAPYPIDCRQSQTSLGVATRCSLLPTANQLLPLWLSNRGHPGWPTVIYLPKLCVYVTPGETIKEKDVKVIHSQDLQEYRNGVSGRRIALHFFQEKTIHTRLETPFPNGTQSQSHLRYVCLFVRTKTNKDMLYSCHGGNHQRFV